MGKCTLSRIALIDADSVLYAAACSSEMRAKAQGDEGEDMWFETRSLSQTYREVVANLEKLVDAVKADDGIVALTTTHCFRYQLLPTYKANRSGGHRPAHLADLQRLVQEKRPFGVLAVKGLEADDICGISSGQLQKAGLREPVIVSIDKDMRQVPGLTYSWRDPSPHVYEVTEEEADRAHLYQTLVGDMVDNYTGCPGIGKVRATKLLDECAHASKAAQWGWVEGAFLSHGTSKEYALTQARVSRILRHTDWDPIQKDVLLWHPPGGSPSPLRLAA